MTPEEMEQQWTRINNSMAFVTEQQAKMAENQTKHDEEIAELRRVQTSMGAGIMEFVKQTHGLFRESEEKRREADEKFEEKINMLIDTVNQMIIDRGDKTILPRYIRPRPKKEGE